MKLISEIIDKYEHNDKVMPFPDFDACVSSIIFFLKKAYEHPDGSRHAKRYLHMAKKLCEDVQNCFHDKHGNLARWLRREPCVFWTYLTGEEKTMRVRLDVEAIYCFLHYCMLMNRCKPVSEQLFERLLLVLCEPSNK